MGLLADPRARLGVGIAALLATAGAVRHDRVGPWETSAFQRHGRLSQGAAATTTAAADAISAGPGNAAPTFPASGPAGPRAGHGGARREEWALRDAWDVRCGIVRANVIRRETGAPLKPVLFALPKPGPYAPGNRVSGPAY